MLSPVIDAVKRTEETTRQEDHLELLITKNLEELNLQYFPRLSESTAFHLLRSAALHRSVFYTAILT